MIPILLIRIDSRHAASSAMFINDTNNNQMSQKVSESMRGMFRRRT